MSRWATTLCFDGEPGDGETRKPFRYAENREPDSEGRSGHLMIAETSEDANWDVVAPFLRLSVSGEGEVDYDTDGVYLDTTLDEAHVRSLYECFGEWLSRLEENAAALHSIESHPGYEYETTEGARECFYDDVPPGGDESWKRNIHRGRGGWERFDYHEEAYWMRRIEEEE